MSGFQDLSTVKGMGGGRKICAIAALSSIMAFASTTQSMAQNGVSINDDGTDPNANAALDVRSPSTGAGKGLLIPRLTNAQRTSAALAGGLLDDSGNLRGGAAQGLLVYQTDGTQGFYYNTSQTSTPSWTFIGSGGGSGATLPITGTVVTIGDNARTTSNGVAVGVSSNADTYGVGVGYAANSALQSIGIGYAANGCGGSGLWSGGVAVGYQANAFSFNGKQSGGVAVGYRANARSNMADTKSGAVAIGYGANGYAYGIGIGTTATGYYQGVAVGYLATGTQSGVAVGYKSNGYVNGTALGYRANAGNQNMAFAKGGYSRAMRYNEEWKGSDTLSEDPATGALSGYNKFGYGQADFSGTTASATATEIFLGGVTNKRFVLQDKSAVCFTAYAVAIDTTSAGGNSSAWIQLGKIKRRLGGATTTIIMGTAILASTEGTLTTAPVWAADTTNGSLKVSVTGVNSATVKWNIMVEYSEVRE